MSDSVLVSVPDTGEPVAVDKIGGISHQYAKMEFGEEGVAVPVSEASPMPTAVFGEVVEQLSAIRMALNALLRTGIGYSLPDALGRLRVNVEAGSNVAVTALPTLAAVTTVATVSSQTNQVNIGNLPATEHIPSLMRLGSDSLRRNITVTP